MGLVPPNHGPLDGETLVPGAILSATRDVEVILDRVPYGGRGMLSADTLLLDVPAVNAAMVAN